MLIVWGKKVIIEPVGYLADFCPICGDITPFLVDEHRSANQIYMVAVDEGELQTRLSQCKKCDFIKTLSIRDDVHYSASPEDLNRLINVTNPSVRETYAKEIELWERIRHNPAGLGSAEREKVIQTTIRSLADMHASRYGRSRLGERPLDGMTLTVAGLPLLFICIGPIIFIDYLERTEGEHMGTIALIMLALSVVGGVTSYFYKKWKFRKGLMVMFFKATSTLKIKKNEIPDSQDEAGFTKTFLELLSTDLENRSLNSNTN